MKHTMKMSLVREVLCTTVIPSASISLGEETTKTISALGEIIQFIGNARAQVWFPT